MNVEKLKRLQSQVRIGGKGTPRRKKKVIHQTAAADDKKLQSSLKKLSVSTIPGIEEVNIIKDDLTVIHFNNPKAQASLSANTFAVTGHGETKKVVEMLPEILPQLGQETVTQLRMFASSMTNNQKDVSDKFGSNMLGNIDEDDVPLLVNDFDEIAKKEDLTKGKKRDRKDDSQHPKNLSANAKALNIQDNALPQGGKKPNEHNESTLVAESPKIKIDKHATPTDGNVKAKAADKIKSGPTQGKSEKKELNAQKGGGNLRPQKTSESLKHEPNKDVNLKAAAAYDVKDILDNLPLSEIKSINVDNFAYVERNAINPSTVKSSIASTCPVQHVTLQSKLSPIDNAGNIQKVAVGGVKTNLIESQLTDVMVLEESKAKEIKNSNQQSKQIVETVNLKMDNKAVVKDEKKTHDSQLSSAEVVTKACVSVGDKIGDMQGMQIAAVPGTDCTLKLENKTEVIKDVKAAIIPAPNVAIFKKEDDIQKNQYEALPVISASSLENKTVSVEQQIAQNNPLQQVAENAATLGLENKENVQEMGADKNQLNTPLSLVCKPAEVKVVQDASSISTLGLENITNMKELYNVAIPLQPPKDIVLTKNTPKEPKVETLQYPAINEDIQKSFAINLDMQKSSEETVKVTDASILNQQIVPNPQISKQPSVVESKPQPNVSAKTSVQKAPQKKGPINKDTGKQQPAKTSSPTAPTKITTDSKKSDVAAKSKPTKAQAPPTPSQSTGATPKPQPTPKLPASPAPKQEKPAVTLKVKPTMSAQTKQPGIASPKPATPSQQKKMAPSPSTDPLVKPGTPIKATPINLEPNATTPSAKPKPDNNIIKDKQPNPQYAAAAEPATKSASPPKAAQQKASDDQMKKPSQ